MYGANDPGHEANVGAKQANAWGLYDMHENVWEWCLDWYTSSYGSAFVIDPVGATSGSDRVLQGGHWSTYAHYCRSAGRYYYGPYDRNGTVGFRVCSAPVAQAADSDGDGMADAWEMLFFQSLKKTADGDADADGRTNAQEEIDNTDPTNPGSTLGLVAYYPFDGDATDATTNGHDGTTFNTTATAGRNGESNSAYQFNGVNSYVNVGSGINPPQFSVSTWIWFDSFLSGAIVSKLHGASPDLYKNFEISVNGGKLFAHIPNGSSWPSVTSEQMLKTNSWNHVIVTYDGATASLYIDGIEDQNHYSGNYVQSNVEVTIGARSDNGSPVGIFLDGSIDDVRIYNRALSSNEVARLYAETAPTNTGSSYQLVEGSFTWHQAKADAEAKGGHLACITSEEEWDDIRTQFDSEFRAGCFWLGATDETVEGNWT